MPDNLLRNRLKRLVTGTVAPAWQDMDRGFWIGAKKTFLRAVNLLLAIVEVAEVRHQQSLDFSLMPPGSTAARAS